jgi:antirestriction protein ArdC
MTVYEVITDRVLDILAKGTVPWKKPWATKNLMPKNLVNKKEYRGINVFLLGAMGYESPYWLSYKQAQQLGGNIKSGEKSCPAIFWKIYDTMDEKSGEKKKIPMARYYQVFNISQCEGIPTTKIPQIEKTTRDNQPIDEAERVISNFNNPPKITFGMSRASYSPPSDEVSMPDKERFDCSESFYGTFFHELVHSTGHEKRLARKGIVGTVNFGSDSYSKEELIAEMGASFLCGVCGLTEKVIEQNAAYIKGWMDRLKEDPKLVVNAAAAAQKAADYILGKKFSEET